LALAVPRAALGGDDLDSAEQFFSDMEFTRALEAVNRSLKSPENGPDDLVAAYRLKGLCLSAIGDTSGAILAFKMLLSIDPAFKSSVTWASEISPKLIAPFYRAAENTRNLGNIALKHIPPEPKEKLGGHRLEVTLLSDPLKMVKAIRFRFLKEGQGKEHRTVLPVKKTGRLQVSLPPGFSGRYITYFFEALNEYGGVLSRSGNLKQPFRLRAGVPRPDLMPAAAPQDPLVSQKDEERRWYETWWFWTAVGLVTAGAATAATLTLSGGEPSGPQDYQIGWGVE
jgi:tetratricopeptide (TPR) repeat protein